LPQRALFASIKASDLLDLGNSNDIPMITLSMDNFRKSTIPSLCLITGAVKSISEGKRAILNGGIYLNWERVVNDRKEDGFSQKDLIENQVCVLGFGKKKTFLIKII
jgi:tyrosyl-tRNA synthetase